MKKFSIYSLLLAILVVLPNIYAQSLPSGIYTSKGGQTTLKLGKLRNDRQQKFDLNTVGANAHTCELEGEIRNGRFERTEESQSVPCVFQISKDRQGYLLLNIEDKHIDACKYYCGMRAFFGGTFKIKSAICNEASQKRFLHLYRAKEYGQALDLLEKIALECDTWDHWSSAFQRSNDLAITYFHLDRRSDCIAALRDFTKAGITSIAANDSEVVLNLIGSQPSFEEIALDQVRAARTNLKLCGYQFPAKKP